VRPIAWKDHYRSELEAAGSRRRLVEWLERRADDRIVEAIERRAIVSVPHTKLEASGPLLAAWVAAVFSSPIDRILALGVLHSGGVPALRTALDETVDLGARRSAFDEVRGAFTPQTRAVETPFRAQPLASLEEVPGVLRADRSGLLREEFSLDTLLAVLRLGAEVFGREPIPVELVYVGMTRDPIEGGFGVARNVATWLRSRWDARTAVVATGDLVHHGAVYGTGTGRSDDREELTTMLRAEVEATLRSALADGDLEAAWRRSTENLGNDQREILPVIVSAIAPRTSLRILHFELTDYASVFDVPRPCDVASALVVYG